MSNPASPKIVAITGAVFIAALVLIIYSPTEKCTEAEFLGNKITHCDELPTTISNVQSLENESYLIGKWQSIKDGAQSLEINFYKDGQYEAKEFRNDGTENSQSGKYTYDENDSILTMIEGDITTKAVIDYKNSNSFDLVPMYEGEVLTDQIWKFSKIG